MQKKVSLVFSEHPTLGDKQTPNTNSRNMITPPRGDVRATPMEHATSVYATNNQSNSPFVSGNNHQNHNHIADLRKKLINVPRQLKTSFDDIDLLPGIERRGSIPMVGSLVYYKRKHQDLGPNYTTTSAPHPTGSNGTSESETSKLKNHELKTFRHFSSPEVIKDHLPFGPHFKHHHSQNTHGVDTECAINDDSDSSGSSSCTQDQDEFSMINSKIHSQIKKNTAKFNKFIHDEREKKKFGRHNFHIPGIDPEVSDSHESLNSGKSGSSLNLAKTVNLGPNINVTPAESISPSTTQELSGHPLEPQTSPPNSRHRRRFTCAMIFTPPKVVEI